MCDSLRATQRKIPPPPAVLLKTTLEDQMHRTIVPLAFVVLVALAALAAFSIVIDG
jgi:hypothetical protein